MHDECAMPAGSDPRHLARVVARSREAALAGRSPDVAPRQLVAESWRRALRSGVDPDRGRATDPVPAEQLEQRRQDSRLAKVMDELRNGLVTLADEGAHIMVITDDTGHLLWREGSPSVLAGADSLGFVDGARWDEQTVGTNGIGTGLVVQRPLQIFAGEHFVRTHHPWICTASPVHDPVDGQLLGMIDLSGPAGTAHPNTLALVASVTRLAETSLRAEHRADLEQLRTVAAPVLAKLGGPALVTDRNGWVAAATEMVPTDRLLLPEEPGDGVTHIPSVGWCRLEPLLDGWLVRPASNHVDQPTAVSLDLRAEPQYLVVAAPSGVWRHRLSTRHAEILFLLYLHPTGRSAAQLSTDLFGDPGHTVAVRAELSRLRRRLGRLIGQRPYRFPQWLEVTCELPADRGALLPTSSAPAVRRFRGGDV